MMNIPTRAQTLIDTLQLQPHPEGGFYREVFRSTTRINVADVRESRCAATTIYFLLTQGMFSRWHRVLSDEIWHWYEGEPLELWLASPDLQCVQRHVLGPVAGEQLPVHTVPAGWWQAARPIGGFVLTGCTVAPGFEFDDFAFLSDDPLAAAALQASNPHCAAWL